MKYYRAIIAVPCEQARLAGAKVLYFKYVDQCAKYFDCSRYNIYRKIRKEKRDLTICGFTLYWEDEVSALRKKERENKNKSLEEKQNQREKEVLILEKEKERVNL